MDYNMINSCCQHGNRPVPEHSYLIADEPYKMDAIPRGICVIFNNKTFDKGKCYDNQLYGPADCAAGDRIVMETRFGTDLDRDALKEAFERFHFMVECHEDASSRRMVQVLQEMSQRGHGRYDCFVCCLLSHGTQGHVYGSDGRPVALRVLTECVGPRVCPTLIGKPKLFFVQACQGADIERGFTTLTTDEPQGLTPNEADFLVSLSVVPGFVSYRDVSKGSPFVAVLADLLKRHGGQKDIIEILTMVNAAMSEQDFLVGPYGLCKQTPGPTFTLRKKLFLDASSHLRCRAPVPESHDRGLPELPECRRFSYVSSVSCRDLATMTAAANSTYEYQIVVTTSPGIIGAGTDANIYVTLHGVKGSSNDLHLKESLTNKNPFESGQMDVFRVFDKELGDLLSVRIRHDNAGLASDWHLSRVEVQDPKTHQTFVFPCGQWLTKTKLQVELPCFETRLENYDWQPTAYRVTVRTSNVAGAGTDARVFLRLVGRHGRSEDLRLKVSENGKNPFETGGQDVFFVRGCRCLGELQTIDIWHDNTGHFPAWHLQSVEVEDLRTAASYTFPCGQWLSSSLGDKSTRRTLAGVRKSSQLGTPLLAPSV